MNNEKQELVEKHQKHLIVKDQIIKGHEQAEKELKSEIKALKDTIGLNIEDLLKEK